MNLIAAVILTLCICMAVRLAMFFKLILQRKSHKLNLFTPPVVGKQETLGLILMTVHTLKLAIVEHLYATLGI
jgi:hypothetical protein